MRIFKLIFPFWFKNLIKKIINTLTIKKPNQIIFFSEPDFSDNSKSLYNEMIKNKLHEKYNIVWIVKDVIKCEKIIKHAKVVKHNTFKSYRYFMRSKYIFATHGFYKFKIKRQVAVNLWHGMPLKQLPGSINLNEKRPSWKSDYVISTANIFNTLMANAFNVKESNVLTTGYPRCDELFVKKDIRKKLNLPTNSKIVLWMPTFRKSFIVDEINGKESILGLPLLNQDNADKLNNVLSNENTFLLVKYHPFAIVDNFISTSSNMIKIEDELFDHDFTLYNLLGNTDMLLTDYSSVYIDYLLINKPIAFVYDDFKEYQESRSFSFDNPKDYMPGKHITSFNDLEDFISKINQEDLYAGKRKEIRDLFHANVDNKSAQRVLKHFKLF